jgi:hypothetical protein
MSQTLKPFPTELSAPINPEANTGRKAGVENHRNLFCAHYDDCLDEAVKRGWNSFTCVRCSLFQQTGEYEGGVEAYATQRRWA